VKRKVTCGTKSIGQNFTKEAAATSRFNLRCGFVLNAFARDVRTLFLQVLYQTISSLQLMITLLYRPPCLTTPAYLHSLFSHP
jgi:hypothetical protein